MTSGSCRQLFIHLCSTRVSQALARGQKHSIFMESSKSCVYITSCCLGSTHPLEQTPLVYTLQVLAEIIVTKFDPNEDAGHVFQRLVYVGRFQPELSHEGDVPRTHIDHRTSAAGAATDFIQL